MKTSTRILFIRPVQDNEASSSIANSPSFRIRVHLHTTTYGVRRQSGAATALWFILPRPLLQGGVPRKLSGLPPHSIVPARTGFGGSGKMLPPAPRFD